MTEQRTILVVEDDPTIRALVTEWLPDDVRRLEATTIADARAQLEAGHVDVVILDLVLPDGEGGALLEEIPPRAAIIAMSGSDRLLSSPGRVVSYLPKPFEPDTLRMLVRQALRSIR